MRQSHRYRPLELHKVSVDIVCGNVPVVSMEKDSIFDENASSMLQAACNSTSKADGLYVDCNEQQIMASCRRLGLDDDCIVSVRLRDHAWNSVKAVGVSGKRSVMMACTVAMSIHDPDGLEELWEYLRSYKLHREYYELLEMVKDSGKLQTTRNYSDATWTSKSWSANDESRNQSKYSGDFRKGKSQTKYVEANSQTKYVEASAHGIDVLFVCGNVPVVSMKKDSIFDENAALMLQSACNSSSKADALYVDVQDQEIADECWEWGYTKDHISIVRMRESQLKSVRAVGGSGKRSTMFACCIAMSLHDPDGLDELWDMLRSYKIHREYYELLELVQGSGQGSSTYTSDAKWSGKRKSRDDGRWMSDSRSQGGNSDWSKPKRVEGPKLSRKGAGKRGSVSTSDLDSQLEAYFDD